MNWISHPVMLEGRLVRLEPLQAIHFEGLVKAASDPRIWAHLAIDGTRRDALLTDLRTALLQRTAGAHYPFAVLAQSSGEVIGTTRYFDLFQEHRKLEIGHTWMAPAYWGKGYNLEVKLLMLQFAFESLHCGRVQIKTRINNMRSRGAIEGLGATLEGVLRNDRVMADGSVLDTALYSLTDVEWPHIKTSLQNRLATF